MQFLCDHDLLEFVQFVSVTDRFLAIEMIDSIGTAQEFFPAKIKNTFILCLFSLFFFCFCGKFCLTLF